MKISPREILDKLQIMPGDFLYVSASAQRFKYGMTETRQLLDALLERLGPEGTLAMPSFTFNNDVGVPEPGSVVDLRHSPSRMGLLSEIFRRRATTLRSESRWLPVAASGRDAADLVSGQLHLKQPFGPGSVFDKMTRSPVKIVGLGVTLNYIVLPHVADVHLASRYPIKVFADDLLTGVLIDEKGESHLTEMIYFPQSYRKLMKPSAVITRSPLLRTELISAEHDGAIFFSVPAATYFSEAMRLGTAAVDRGELPPWL